MVAAVRPARTCPFRFGIIETRRYLAIATFVTKVAPSDSESSSYDSVALGETRRDSTLSADRQIRHESSPKRRRRSRKASLRLGLRISYGISIVLLFVAEDFVPVLAKQFGNHMPVSDARLWQLCKFFSTSLTFKTELGQLPTLWLISILFSLDQT